MPLRILFIGMQGKFSLPPFRELIAAGHPPLALVTPPPPGMAHAFRRLHFPPVNKTSNNLYGLAEENGVPIFEIGRLKSPDVLDWLQALNPDLIVVACFNRLLPKAWLEFPRLGCINLHPSLLPAYRGPTPLEDQLAAGETRTGITLHFMDEGADTGDIIGQEVLPIPAGADLPALERQAAEAGAAMLLKILEKPEDIPRRRQI